MRPVSILLSLAVAAAALVLPAAARLHYYKGLTTVADLESLRLLDDEGRFRKHTLVAFTLPDDGSSACALEQLEALRFPHLFFHLPGTIFEMIQVFVDPDTELTQALLPKTSHKDACRSFLFIPQNTTVAAAGQGAEAEGRRLLAQSQRELEGWFWGLQCAATGPFAFKNDIKYNLTVYRERPQPRKLEMEFPPPGDNSARSDFGSKDKRHHEELVATVAPGEHVVLNASSPICRGHTAVFRRFGGRMFARLIVGDEDLLPAPYDPKSTNASEGEGGVLAVGLRAKADKKKSPDWDPRRLQLTDELTELYRTRREYNFKRLERIEHAPRRTPALTTEGFIKERLPQAAWEVMVEKYEEAVEESKHTLEMSYARTLTVENVRVPLPTVVQHNRNSNPQPITSRFGEYEKFGREWKAMGEALVPRIEAWLGRKGLEPTLLSEFRRYYNGSMLRDHVEGMGGVGVILNMDQETEEPWELHILDHQGRRHRITLEPGEMVMYQPDRVAHGRPLPLAGQYYDNVYFRVDVRSMERRPVSPIEANLGLLETQDLPSDAKEAHVAGEGEGLTAEL